VVSTNAGLAVTPPAPSSQGALVGPSNRPPANATAIVPPSTPATQPAASQQLFVVDRFLQNQTKELELRAAQVEIQKKETEQAHAYACKALEAQGKDRT